MLADADVTAKATKLLDTYGDYAIRAARAGLEASRDLESIEFWTAVCKYLLIH